MPTVPRGYTRRRLPGRRDVLDWWLSEKSPGIATFVAMPVFVRNILCDDSNECMATDRQIILDECRAAVA